MHRTRGVKLRARRSDDTDRPHLRAVWERFRAVAQAFWRSVSSKAVGQHFLHAILQRCSPPGSGLAPRSSSGRRRRGRPQHAYRVTETHRWVDELPIPAFRDAHLRRREGACVPTRVGSAYRTRSSRTMFARTAPKRRLRRSCHAPGSAVIGFKSISPVLDVSLHDRSSGLRTRATPRRTNQSWSWSEVHQPSATRKWCFGPLRLQDWPSSGGTASATTSTSTEQTV